MIVFTRHNEILDLKLDDVKILPYNLYNVKIIWRACMGQYDDIKKQIVTTAQMLTQKGYLIATGGNLSIRIPGQDAFAITPTNYDYMKMVPDDVCVLDFDIHALEGERKPSV